MTLKKLKLMLKEIETHLGSLVVLHQEISEDDLLERETKEAISHDIIIIMRKLSDLKQICKLCTEKDYEQTLSKNQWRVLEIRDLNWLIRKTVFISKSEGGLRMMEDLRRELQEKNKLRKPKEEYEKLVVFIRDHEKWTIKASCTVPKLTVKDVLVFHQLMAHLDAQLFKFVVLIDSYNRAT
jgi:hypothetical protein